MGNFVGFFSILAYALNQLALIVHELNDVITDTCLKVAGCIKRNERTLRKNTDSIAKRLRFFNIMCRYYDSSTLHSSLANDVRHLPPYLRIQANRGLIEKKNRRFRDQSSGDEKSALHAARKSCNQVISTVPEINKPKADLDSLLAVWNSMQETINEEIFVSCEFTVEVILLRYHSDQSLDGNGVFNYIELSYKTLSRVRF